MNSLSSFLGKPPAIFRSGLWGLTLGLAALIWLTCNLPAQDPGKKSGEEVEEPVKTKPVPKVGDEPASQKGPGGKDVKKETPPKRTVAPPKDNDPPPSKPPTKPGLPRSEEPVSDLSQAMQLAKNPDLQEFYRGLMMPHDVITLDRSGHIYNVDPLPQLFSAEFPRFAGGKLTIRPFGPDWRHAPSMEIGSGEARTIVPYEEKVIRQVDSFLLKALDKRAPQDQRYLSRSAMLQAAETVLAAAYRFHNSAWERGVRQGEEWKPLARRMRDQLFSVQLQQLTLRVQEGTWEAAAELARSLLASNTLGPEEREQVAGQLAGLLKKGLEGEFSEAKLKEARQRLLLMEKYFPDSPAVRPVADGLRQQAQSLLEEAQAFQKAGKSEEALGRLRIAQEVWPQLPGLRDQWVNLNKTHQVLHIGVRDLPVQLWPGLATTDVERQAGELLFESLIRLVDDPEVGQYYQPVLADGLPHMVPLGREFSLLPSATWSDGERLRATDVAATLRWLGNTGKAGASSGLTKLLESKPEVGDPFHFTLFLKQGYLDPLSLMTFKILPRKVLEQDLRPGVHPLGSGPFQYEGQFTRGNRPAVRFRASPGYASRNRDSKLVLPRLQEIQFLQYDKSDELADALIAGQIDLIANPPGEVLKKVQSADSVEVVGPLPTRRVNFLAINHRRPALKNENLRRALALAINRDKILDNCFRVKPGQPVHRALNGPFPAGSWPCDPTVMELFRPEPARAFLKEAKNQPGGAREELSLKYPKDQPEVEKAMKDLCLQVKTEIQIDLKLEPVEAHKLRDDVEQLQNYDLAYYYHDYPSEAFWLWPLFDPNSIDPGGSNYMGVLESDLTSLLSRAMNSRNFGHVQETMRMIHRMLDKKMPLIPLWQLDTIIAHRKELKATPFDPLLLFRDVEHWTKGAP